MLWYHLYDQYFVETNISSNWWKNIIVKTDEVKGQLEITVKEHLTRTSGLINENKNEIETRITMTQDKI